MVPGPAGVAVAAAEGERQVLVAEADQVRHAGLGGAGIEVGNEDGIRQAPEESGAGRVGNQQRTVAGADEVQQILLGDMAAADEDAAAHDVEGDIGEVVGGRQLVGRVLEAIGGGDQA